MCELNLGKKEGKPTNYYPHRMPQPIVVKSGEEQKKLSHCMRLKHIIDRFQLIINRKMLKFVVRNVSRNECVYLKMTRRC